MTPSTEVLYLTFNRLEFTRFSFRTLLDNTDWSLVDRLVVMDDGSTDGTREWIEQAMRDVPVDTTLRAERAGSPPALMNFYLRGAECDRFVKLDNDIAVPPGWLNNLSDVMDAHPEVDLLGMEGGRMGVPRDDPQTYGYTLATHIGGVGMMRRDAFRGLPPIPAQGRFGFTQWQQDHGLVRGWITPDLLVCELDKVPEEPWLSLTGRYIGNGWARQWGTYDPRWGYWYEWFDPAVVAECMPAEVTA